MHAERLTLMRMRCIDDTTGPFDLVGPLCKGSIHRFDVVRVDTQFAGETKGPSTPCIHRGSGTGSRKPPHVWITAR